MTALEVGDVVAVRYGPGLVEYGTLVGNYLSLSARDLAEGYQVRWHRRGEDGDVTWVSRRLVHPVTVTDLEVFGAHITAKYTRFPDEIFEAQWDGLNWSAEYGVGYKSEDLALVAVHHDGRTS